MRGDGLGLWEVVSRCWHSALDTATEKDIQKALQHLAEGRSSLAIAHRLSVRGPLYICGVHWLTTLRTICADDRDR